MKRLARLALLLAISSCVSSEDPDEARSGPVFTPSDPSSLQLAEQLAMQHLERVSPDLLGQVTITQVRVDELGQAQAKVSQSVAGVPVFGAHALVMLDASGKVIGMLGQLAHDIRVDATVSIDAAAATSIALGSQGALLAQAASRADLQILIGHGKDRLTHRVQLAYELGGRPHRPVVFVDAKTGEVAWTYDNLQTAKNREMHNLNHGTTLPGPTVRTEGGPATGDSDLDTNYNDLGATWDCYSQLYGRDSFDGAGAKLISSVHYSTNYVNAFWDGTQMVYGDGDNVNSRSLAIALDVTAHELTHAVTERTSGLIYAGESGGLNESMSDIFGNNCEWFRDNAGNTAGPTSADNYLVGEEVWLAAPALRFMADPALDGSSLDFWTSGAGNVDVHYSSGISNLAFHLLAEGGTHPRGKSPQVVTGIGMHAAGRIFYRANSTYLQPSSNFGAARAATVQAATDLFGASSAQVTQVNNAWTAVGVLPPPNYVVIDTQPGLASSTQLNFNYASNGATAMKFEITGGTGDADIYVRRGSPPTTTLYDCRPFTSGNNEVCEFNPSPAGTYYVMIVAFSPFSGVTLRVSAAGQGQPTTETSCTDGVDNDGDGATDCADSDCAGNPACAPTTETSCTDGIDNDGDGATDCADSDCASNPACQNNWVVISSTNFESGLGPYQTGGSDAARVNSSTNANSPPFSVRIRDNAGTGSSFFTQTGMNLTGRTQIRVQFSAMARSMENGEDYVVELSTGGGAYAVVGSFVAGTHFTNGVRQTRDLQLALPATKTNVKVRFRNDASANDDHVFIDDVVISAR